LSEFIIVPIQNYEKMKNLELSKKKFGTMRSPRCGGHKNGKKRFHGGGDTKMKKISWWKYLTESACNQYDFGFMIEPVESSLPLGWPAGGGQLGVASWGWLQSPFFIVCLNQCHFFSKSLFIIFYEFFEVLSSKYHGEREKVGWPARGSQQSPFFIRREVESGERVIQEHESPNKSLRLSLP
jgi:hypothetical protein